MTNRELKDLAIRAQEIDEQLHALFARREALQEGLTQEEKNKLWDMIMSDHKPHFG